jgi:hydroxypyruvate reductase
VDINPRDFLTGLFHQAVAAAHPSRVVSRNLPLQPRGRTVVIGAGKAAGAMAKAVEDNWRGPLSGLVVTRYDHGTECRSIEVVEAGHPVPDAAGQQAAQRMLGLLRGLAADDLVLCLMSGGGSSLLAVPAPGISLADKQAVTRALLRSGAPISQINCVRKHLSSVKGGRLALAAAPASVVTLIISDVPGDDPATVASGPTVPDPTTRRDALGILANYSIDVPDAVGRRLEDPQSETPKPGDPGFARVENRIIATAGDALNAAAHAAELAGIRPVVLGAAIQGEARDVAREHARLATKCVRRGDPLRPPCVLLSGGETTVTVAGGGRGGRNSEYLLALALELDGLPNHAALACDTDGIDGTEQNAGAVIDAETLRRARAKNVSAEDALAKNDAYGFFDALGDLVTTGPTRTNVNDFRAILLTESGR